MNIVILGGGISGLSAAWYARKKYPTAKIRLLEKNNRLGGVIETVKESGFIFEKGPRTFQLGKCPHILELIDEVGLQNELLFSGKNGSTRYLYEKGKLRSMASFLPTLLPALLREAFVPRAHLEDESIYDFAARRFSPKIAESFFDPMTLGIYSGDIRKLSVKSCFPKFVEWEREKGSCFRGALSSFWRKNKDSGVLFTLKGGMERLIEGLAKKINVDICLQCEVEAVEKIGVFAGGKSFDADLIFSALPGSVISTLAGVPFDAKEASLWVANFCYAKNVLPKKGFGYLVPSKEKESLLGVIWDSSIFPEQNGAGKTCLTAMMREGTVELLKKILSRHLSIDQEPLVASSYTAEKAIPQFEVGYSVRLAHFKEQIQKKIPHLCLLGNYLRSPSVESCIAIAKESV